MLFEHMPFLCCMFSGCLALQPTDGKHALEKTCEKVRVPLGRECYWETSMLGSRSLERSFLQRIVGASRGACACVSGLERTAC